MAEDLNENKFIAEQYSKDPSPFWIWLGVIAALALLLWAGQSFYYQWVEERLVDSPFLQVTNREMSLFLWQNPEHMRANVSKKTGYLSAFEKGDKIALDPLLAENYVEAPPELLFLYHTWRRQIYQEFPITPILTLQFKEFIGYAAEWQPEFWTKAPKEYAAFVESLLKNPLETMEKTGKEVPLSLIPFEVQRAFQGWKNFFIDKEAINKITPSMDDISNFLKKYPHYARNYWRNIVPNYLKSLSLKETAPKEGADKKTSIQEIPPFLRVALFNFEGL